ncbi:MAG TPA: ATP-binding protein [Chloroflexota bacterium]|nr:ATP-binding protein [Chloroflexota bacterium]
MAPARIARVLGEGRWLGHLAALAAVALMTVFIALVLARVHIANIAMLYLFAVLATALLFGSGPAVVASIAAFLTFDFFFTEPYHTFTVADPGEWVALLLFLVTALVTGQLMAALRRRAREAEQRQREAAVLYDVTRLMTGANLEQALHDVAERLRAGLELAAVAIRLRVDDRLSARAAVGEHDALLLAGQTASAPGQLLQAGEPPTGGQRGRPGRWVRFVPPRTPGAAKPTAGRLHLVPVQAAAGRAGEVVLVRPERRSAFSDADTRLLSAVAAQLGSAVDRTRFQREATEAEILRGTDELRRALINAVSHDLRTPLATIIASADTLRQRNVDWSEDERDGFARGIGEEAHRLNRIVGNLLDLSRIEAGALRPDKRSYDLGALVDEVVGRLRPLTAGHRVVVSVPDDLPPLRLDYVEIDQVLSNLIENAAKYAPPGTEIAVSARRLDHEAEVEVADRGPGIPAAALPRLFEPFYRLDGDARRPQGSGLGLTVARGLVEAHGGRIRAENRADGGARFVFTLPLPPRSAGGPDARGAAP